MDTYRVHVNDNESNNDHLGISYREFYIYTLYSQGFYFSSECLR